MRLREAWVGNLELCVRAANALQAHHVHTIGQLDDMRDSELLRFPNFGRLSLKQTRGAVNDLRSRYHSGACEWHWPLSPVPEHLRGL